ncbi:MAG: hypothetical protein HKO07_07895, partial [Pseudomonadales bacterium]|nr:hypothetical protein [Pseudomonadales bacterium]
MKQILNKSALKAAAHKLPWPALALLICIAQQPAHADRGPGAALTANNSHTHAVTRSTSGEDITISLQTSKRVQKQSAATSDDFAVAEQTALLK